MAIKNSQSNEVKVLRPDAVSKKNPNLNKFDKKKIIIPEFTSKVELLKQANKVASYKNSKGQNYLNDLPEGVRKSIEEKERINLALNFGKSNEAEEIRKRLSIEKKPIDKKRANELRNEREAFFRANIEKLQMSNSSKKRRTKKASI
ncbi:hypothetical protein [Spiroplasma floricola]|uniref:Uncharacterized protein n=1 Tax=Spiroplasma floricola 23-6 TaxID=1336749 RepID=A0A2K8SDJ9_9MOLU|nr:hypothetical protein [Spiroplasma floricola]AUB31536.1 hypothetical protein SFLOR_v1c04840 [Spiroplasma floricola 23-6]